MSSSSTTRASPSGCAPGAGDGAAAGGCGPTAAWRVPAGRTTVTRAPCSQLAAEISPVLADDTVADPEPICSAVARCGDPASGLPRSPHAAVRARPRAFAPLGAWLAIRARSEPPPVVLALAVLLWVAGFDTLRLPGRRVRSPGRPALAAREPGCAAGADAGPADARRYGAAPAALSRGSTPPGLPRGRQRRGRVEELRIRPDPSAPSGSGSTVKPKCWCQVRLGSFARRYRLRNVASPWASSSRRDQETSAAARCRRCHRGLTNSMSSSGQPSSARVTSAAPRGRRRARRRGPTARPRSGRRRRPRDPGRRPARDRRGRGGLQIPGRRRVPTAPHASARGRGHRRSRAGPPIGWKTLGPWCTRAARSGGSRGTASPRGSCPAARITARTAMGDEPRAAITSAVDSDACASPPFSIACAAGRSSTT